MNIFNLNGCKVRSYTIEEAAKEFGVTPLDIRRAAKRGTTIGEYYFSEQDHIELEPTTFGDVRIKKPLEWVIMEQEEMWRNRATNHLV